MTVCCTYTTLRSDHRRSTITRQADRYYAHFYTPGRSVESMLGRGRSPSRHRFGQARQGGPTADKRSERAGREMDARRGQHRLARNGQLEHRPVRPSVRLASRPAGRSVGIGRSIMHQIIFAIGRSVGKFPTNITRSRSIETHRIAGCAPHDLRRQMQRRRRFYEHLFISGRPAIQCACVVCELRASPPACLVCSGDRETRE